MIPGMTRILIALAALMFVSAPASAAERRYAVEDFERLIVEGPYIVRLRSGRASSAVATGGQAALDRVAIDVTGQTLRIRRNVSAWGGNPGTQDMPLTIELTTRTLRSARLVGSATLDIEGAEGLRLDFSVEGGGRLRVANVRADNLALGVAGSGKLEVTGTAEVLQVGIHGTGDLDAAGLRAENARLSTATTGTVRVEVTRTATIDATGLGTVEILGSGDCTVRGPTADLVRCNRPLDQR